MVNAIYFKANEIRIIKNLERERERVSSTHSKMQKRQADGRVEENKESWKWSFS